MKKVLLVSFLLLSFIGISQNAKTTTLPTYNSEKFVWKNGAGNYVDVKFQYLVPKEKNLTKEVLDNVVMNIMVKSKFKLKNQISFNPKKLTITYSEDDGTYTGISIYVGKNSYGVESESTTYFSITIDGEIEEMMTM
jgi:hypothetical protein